MCEWRSATKSEATLIRHRIAFFCGPHDFHSKKPNFPFLHHIFHSPTTQHLFLFPSVGAIRAAPDPLISPAITLPFPANSPLPRYESRVVRSISPFSIALTIPFIFAIVVPVFQKGVCGFAQFVRIGCFPGVGVGGWGSIFSCLLTLDWIEFFWNMIWSGYVFFYKKKLKVLFFVTNARYVYACDFNELKNSTWWLVSRMVGRLPCPLSMRSGIQSPGC